MYKNEARAGGAGRLFAKIPRKLAAKAAVAALVFFICLSASFALERDKGTAEAYAAAGGGAQLTAEVPDYRCIVGYSEIDYRNSLYPFLNYRNITYFPMTWDYCDALGLTSQWVEEEGLYIAYTPWRGAQSSDFPTYGSAYNPGTVNVRAADFPVYVNGKKIDVAGEEYPLLLFREITYFPMTWRFARDEFCWSAAWNGEAGVFDIERGLGGNFSVAMDFYDADEAGAKIEKYISESIPISGEGDDTVYTTRSSARFFRLDYADGSLSEDTYEKDGYTSPDAYERARYAESEKNSGKAEIKGSWVYYEGEPVAEIKALAPNRQAEESGASTDAGKYSASYREESEDGIELLQLSVNTNTDVPAPYTPFESYLYIRQGGKLSLAGENCALEALYRGPDENIYYNLKRYTGWKGYTFYDSELWRMGPDGTAERMNTGVFEPFGSVKLIGRDAEGRLYLKCEMGHESGSIGYGGVGEHAVAPAVDGYYRYDGGSLEKLALYSYSDDETVSPDGRIYTLLNWKDAAERVY